MSIAARPDLTYLVFSKTLTRITANVLDVVAGHGSFHTTAHAHSLVGPWSCATVRGCIGPVSRSTSWYLAQVRHRRVRGAVDSVSNQYGCVRGSFGPGGNRIRSQNLLPL